MHFNLYIQGNVISSGSKQQLTSKKGSSAYQPVEWISELLERESSDMLTLWSGGITPKFIWGDFNGDKTIDLLIPASINRKTEFNYKKLSSFYVDKAQAIGVNPKAKFPVEKLKPDNDVLLVIFHGVPGSTADSFQVGKRYIIIDGTYKNPERMILFRGKLKPATAGDELKVVTPPLLNGDAILFLDDEGGTAIYWYKERYHWYPINDLNYYQQRNEEALPAKENYN
jgi:hypothetical protein